jgi:hypothetical protein
MQKIRTQYCVLAEYWDGCYIITWKIEQQRPSVCISSPGVQKGQLLYLTSQERLPDRALDIVSSAWLAIATFSLLKMDGIVLLLIDIKEYGPE